LGKYLAPVKAPVDGTGKIINPYRFSSRPCNPINFWFILSAPAINHWLLLCFSLYHIMAFPS